MRYEPEIPRQRAFLIKGLFSHQATQNILAGASSSSQPTEEEVPPPVN